MTILRFPSWNNLSRWPLEQLLDERFRVPASPLPFTYPKIDIAYPTIADTIIHVERGHQALAEGHKLMTRYQNAGFGTPFWWIDFGRPFLLPLFFFKSFAAQYHLYNELPTNSAVHGDCLLFILRPFAGIIKNYD